MISTQFGSGLGVCDANHDANAEMARAAGAFRAPAAHADWAVEAPAPQRLRRTATATIVSVNRGFA
jgi:hypothetical protein